CRNQGLVIQPPWLASAERDESGYVWDFRSNTIDPFKVIDVRTDDARAAVLNQIRKIVGGQPVVQRDQNGACLRHDVKRFQLRMGIGGDVSDAVGLFHTERLQRRRPRIASVEKLLVT